MLGGLDRQTSVSRIVNTNLDARELIEAVMLDFGLDPGQGRSKPLLLRDLARYLVEQRSAGRLALLVIDEAQNLSPSALEEIRMLSNLETEKSKLIQIALVGQPNLRHVLGRPEFEQLRQRVTVSYHLKPLDADETAAYINHRLRHAAIGAPLEFSRDVTDLIHLHSQGVPRKINVIADAALLFGYGEEQKSITVDLTHTVLEELESTGVIELAHPAATSEQQERAQVPAQARSETQARQDAELAAREQRLAQRERQLAEQQRILTEEYRLLRLRKDMTSAAPGPKWAGQAAPAAPPAPRQAAPAPRATPSHAEPPSQGGMWTRVRSLFGAV